jgi:hypothetical protein
MVGSTVPPRSDAVQAAALLDSPEIGQLVNELAMTRWTGRPGYPIRMMVGVALAKSLFTLSTWTRIVALVREHAGLGALQLVGGDRDPGRLDHILLRRPAHGQLTVPLPRRITGSGASRVTASSFSGPWSPA